MTMPYQKFHFEKTITLGHILTSTSMLASVIACLIYFDHRVTILEVKVPMIEQSIIAVASTIKNVSDAQVALAKSLEHITSVLEERSRLK